MEVASFYVVFSKQLSELNPVFTLLCILQSIATHFLRQGYLVYKVVGDLAAPAFFTINSAGGVLLQRSIRNDPLTQYVVCAKIYILSLRWAAITIILQSATAFSMVQSGWRGTKRLRLWFKAVDVAPNAHVYGSKRLTWHQTLMYMPWKSYFSLFCTWNYQMDHTNVLQEIVKT